MKIEQVRGVITYPNQTVVARGLSFITDLVLADFTGDTEMDLVALGPLLMEMTRRLPDGTFSSSVSIGRPGNEAAEAGDLDGDGDQDMVLAESKDFAQGVKESISLLWNKGEGEFKRQELVSSGRLRGPTRTIGQTNGRDVKIVDMDGDSDLDIVATVSTSAFSSPSLGFLMLFRNDGDGDFSSEFIAENLSGVAVVDTADFNLDGIMDIALLEVSILPRTRPLRVYYGSSTGDYTPSPVDNGADGCMGMSVGLLNEDEYPDILTIGLRDIVVYFGTPSGGFRKVKMVRFDTSLHKSGRCL